MRPFERNARRLWWGWIRGSIAWAGALSHNSYDNNVARITGNVLRRFIDDTPF